MRFLFLTATGTRQIRDGRRMENSSPLSVTGLDRLEFTGKDLMVKRREDSLRPTSLILLIFIPRGFLWISMERNSDVSGARIIQLQNGSGRFFAPPKAWIFADDAFDREERPFERHYFYPDELIQMDVPMGKVTVEASQGP